MMPHVALQFVPLLRGVSFSGRVETSLSRHLRIVGGEDNFEIFRPHHQAIFPHCPKNAALLVPKYGSNGFVCVGAFIAKDYA